VDLKMTGRRGLPGGLDLGGSQGGARHLLCRRLEIALRADRTVEQIVAQSDVDLTLMPGPGQHPERRHVEAKRYLIMDADETGRATNVRAGQDVALTVEPWPPRPDVPRRGVTCNRFEAAIDPPTGRTTFADFFGGVTFTRGSQRARGQTAHYDGARSSLALNGRPNIDDATGTLEATDITLGTESGDVEARGDVRHLIRQAERGRGGLFASGEEPALIAAQSFESTRKTQSATYGGGVVLRSGRSEVRAASLVIQEEAEGRRRLHADGKVVSILAQDTGGKERGSAAGPLEGRGDTMDYDEERRLIVYEGDAIVKQADVETRSPKATLTLSADMKSLEKLVAGQPVEVVQGDRRATGRLGTFTPADRMMLLVGDHVVLTDPGQRTVGRSVAFMIGGDRIVVDGQEETRTESTFEQSLGGTHR
jgi:lipopolysaccharide transport protein LptA